MHVTETQLAMESQHSSQITTATLVESSSEPATDAAPINFGQIIRELQIELLHLIPAHVARVDELPAANQRTQKDQALDSVLAMLLGLQTKPSNVAAADKAPARFFQEPPPLAQMEQVLRVEQTSESEVCRFAATGKVCLEDGSERQFNVGYQLERSEQTTDISRLALMDPLLLERAAPQASLSADTVAFDLNSDGEAENMRLPAKGSSLLFYDRNHNGIADNGGELFGPASGDGFAELASLDSDGNGWIDGADAAYASLKLWLAQGGGQTKVESLSEAGIGALATEKIDTPFQLREQGAVLGQVRTSSVWLGEQEGAGFVRQVDLATTPRPSA